jgi:hypothetical protein
MKRLAVTSFAFLYAVLIVVGGVERTTVWASRQADFYPQLGSIQSASQLAFRDSSRHHPQSKILENPFVVEPPRPNSTTLLVAERNTGQCSSECIVTSEIRQIPSRAPPVSASRVSSSVAAV